MTTAFALFLIIIVIAGLAARVHEQRSQLRQVRAAAEAQRYAFVLALREMGARDDQMPAALDEPDPPYRAARRLALAAYGTVLRQLAGRP